MLVEVKVTVGDSPKKRRCWKEGDGDEKRQGELVSRSTTRMSKGHLGFELVARDQTLGRVG